MIMECKRVQVCSIIKRLSHNNIRTFQTQINLGHIIKFRLKVIIIISSNLCSNTIKCQINNRIRISLSTVILIKIPCNLVKDNSLDSIIIYRDKTSRCSRDKNHNSGNNIVKYNNSIHNKDSSIYSKIRIMEASGREATISKISKWDL